MKRSEQFAKLSNAMAKAQMDFKNAERDRDNPFFSSTYSTMAAVLDACREPLAKNGIAVFQATEDSENDHLKVTTLLSFEDEWLETELKVKVMSMKVEKAQGDTAAVKAVTPQAQGSASTYACRIALRSLLVVASEASDDDDGNAASGVKPSVGAFQDAILNVTSETKQGKNKKPFTIYRIETAEHGELATFNEDLAKEAERHKGTGQMVDLEGRKNEKGFGIDLIRVAAAGAQPMDNAPKRASENGKAPNAPTKPTRAFVDSAEEIASRQELGRIRYGIRTAHHDWVATYDEVIVKKVRACVGTNGLCSFGVTGDEKNALLVEFTELTPDEVSKLGRAEIAPA